MFERKRYIYGVETGTSKVRVAVGEKSPSGAVSIVHVSEMESNGVVKGEVVNPTAAGDDIRNALADAEEKTDTEISHVVLGVTGRHLQGDNHRGLKNIPTVDRAITKEDIDDVVADARAISLPGGQCLIHCIRQNFTVDDQTNIPNPEGVCGSRLEAYVHVVHGNEDRSLTALRLLKQLELTVDEVAFNGLASAMALLEPEQKELGALVIDLGAGTTEFVVYSNCIIKHTGVVAVGGHNVTNDLALGLGVSQVQAEQLKLKHGSAVVEESCKGQTVTLPSINGLKAKTVSLEHLRRIQSLRLEETFEIIADQIGRNNLWECLGAGVYLCGGGSRTPGIEALARRIFQMPVSVGVAALGGPTNFTAMPEFQTVIGLVRFGASQQSRRSRGDSVIEVIADGIVGGLAGSFKALNPWKTTGPRK